MSRHISDYLAQKIPSGMRCLSDGLPHRHPQEADSQAGLQTEAGKTGRATFLPVCPMVGASLGSLAPSDWCLGSCVGLF